MEVGDLGPYRAVPDSGFAIDLHLTGNFHRQRHVGPGATAANGQSLVHQSGQRHLPALAHFAQAKAVRYPDVGEVHLIEIGITGQLLDRFGLHTGSFHIHQEGGQPLVFGHRRVGAGHNHAVVRVVGAGGPDFLAIDDPLVAVLLGLGAQCREVGTAGGLREQLAPDFFAAGEFGQETITQLGGTPGHDGGRDHALSDNEEARGDVVFVLLLTPDYPLDGCCATATVFLIPADAGPAAVVFALLPQLGDGEPTQALGIFSCQAVVGQPLGSLGAEGGFVGSVIKVHG